MHQHLSEHLSKLTGSYDQLHRRLLAQEDSHRDLLRVVKLLQSYNENQDMENVRTHEQLKQMDKLVRLVEERAVNQRAWADDMELRVGDQMAGMREEMVRDIKMVGKELAIDIVALNKKIDTRTHTQVERMRQWEAVIKKCEQRVHRLMKQYNTVS